MRAVLIERHGGPEVLNYTEDFPEPRLMGGEVLVRVRACALNHLDVFVREGIAGLRLPLPHILGSDIAGEIAKAGKGGSEGERVVVNPGISCGKCGFCRKGGESLCKEYRILGEHLKGGYAELVKVPQNNIVRIPDWISFEEASSLPLTFMTAWRMLKRAGLKKGEEVLVIGAGGGVSTAAVQLAKAVGARVFVVSSSREKLKRAKRLGATVVVDDSNDFGKKVWELTGKEGVDVVVDSVGKDTFIKSLRCLKRDGRLVTCGATSGPLAEVDLRTIFWRQLRIIGSTMGSAKELEEALSFVWKKKARPVVDKVLPLERAREAHELLEQGRFFGKIVLKV